MAGKPIHTTLKEKTVTAGHILTSTDDYSKCMSILSCFLYLSHSITNEEVPIKYAP